MNTKKTIFISIITPIIVLAFYRASGAESTITQSFDADPGWIGNGNTANGNNYGYRFSNHTGGTSGPGEAGGVFGTSVRTYYGDVLAVPLSLDNAFSASGRMNYVWESSDFNHEMRIGYFSTDMASNTFFVGIGVLENGPTSGRVQPDIFFSATNYQNNPQQSFNKGIHTWSFNYNPSGNGSLTYAWDGTTVGTVTLSAANRARGMQLDAFGLSSLGGGDGSAELYIDDITYTMTVVAPLFTQQPSNQVVSTGQGFTFNASATGYPTPIYQWQFSSNGVSYADISGATGASYSLGSSSVTNIGYYRVVAANSVGTNNTVGASLTFLNLNLYAGLNILGPIGANYAIQSTPNLGTSNWTTLTNVSLPTQPYVYIDYSSPTNVKQFYRANPQ